MTEQEAIDYYNNIVIDTKIGLENICKTSDLINISIKALEKQMLKKPIIKSNKVITYAECPNCQTMIKTSYCPECGQSIDWSDYD